MFIKQLDETRFDRFYHSLMRGAHAEPLDASYTVNVKINRAEYDVKLQPEEENQIAVLQALRVDRNKYGPDFTLITDDRLLSSLLEILIAQGID
ncbi:hypothetical protein [Anaeromassilibacillus senegalensis]|uniref:hypothetical protein n=1 Tax=Anaeromassilibacillus senegalensis TaxID=1673717 RepID=UPI0006824796|nr:hypothetical protein [Anaeromassilibacillus senegalensis]